MLPATPQAVTRAGQWWLTALHVPAALRAAPEAGKGVTVAVLSTGVDAKHPDLTGTVTEGPDFSKTGRAPGDPYWGEEGTAVASLIAGHGHGPGGTEGITGVAPGAKILSVQVTLEYDDPLNSDAAVTQRTCPLPSRRASGTRSATALPSSPSRLTLARSERPPPEIPPRAAARPSARPSASRSRITSSSSRRPATTARAADSVNYPAAYPGVIAVGATARNGQLAPFTNSGSYVTLTAPGSGATPDRPISGGMTADPAAGLTVAAPDGGYEPLASSDMSAALTAGVAALIRSRYPWLTVGGGHPGNRARRDPAARRRRPSGRGGLGARRTRRRGGAYLRRRHRGRSPGPAPPRLRAGHRARRRARRQRVPRTRAAAGQSDPGGLLRSLVVDLAVAAGVLIACLVGAITLTRLRRRARGR